MEPGFVYTMAATRLSQAVEFLRWLVSNRPDTEETLLEDALTHVGEAHSIVVRLAREVLSGDDGPAPQGAP